MSATFPPAPGSAADNRTVLGYAGFWWRALAWGIDSVVLSVVDLLLGRLTGWRNLGTDAYRFPTDDDAPVAAVAYTQTYTIQPHLPHLHGGGLTLAGLVLTIGYFALLESSRWQATLGKRACRLSVTDLAGRRIGVGRALGRYLSKFISMILFGIGFLMVAWTHRKQGLHDKIAGTLVLRRRPAEAVFAFAPPSA